MPSTRPRLLSVRRTATLAALLVVAGTASAAAPPDGPLVAPARLASDFAARVVATAASLAERGPRPAGSPGERAAERAVTEALREIGLTVERDPFAFDGFEMKTSDLKLAGRKVPTVVVGFDPFRGPFEFEREALAMKGGETPPADVAGRIVVTDHPLVLLMLLDEKPALVVCVAEADFAAFAAGEPDPRGDRRRAVGGPGRELAPASRRDGADDRADLLPGMVQEAVGESAKELGLEPKQRNLISDHRTFMQAGVPAIGIQSGQHTIHSRGDTGEKLQAETIGKAGALAAAVLWKGEGRSRAPVTPPGE